MYVQPASVLTSVRVVNGLGGLDPAVLALPFDDLASYLLHGNPRPGQIRTGGAGLLSVPLLAFALALAFALRDEHRHRLRAAGPPRLAFLRHPVGRREELQALPSPVVPRHGRPLLRVPRALHLVHERPIPIRVQPAPANDVLQQVSWIAGGPVWTGVPHQRVRTVEADLDDAGVRRRSVASGNVDWLLLPLHELRKVRLRVWPQGHAPDEKLQLLIIEVIRQVACIFPLDDLVDCLLLEVDVLPYRHHQSKREPAWLSPGARPPWRPRPDLHVMLRTHMA
mmetsp:Transcript_10522/g.29662  ORF Transcript_10522/g.29662 Transcript_10522/m.29662 type:complete len:281 (+) Transcript_10522:236-1078(+)